MLCRLCLHDCDSETAFALFLNNGEESSVNKLIAKYVVFLQVTQFDAVSTIICQGCNKQLDDFDKFIQIIEQRQHELRNEFMEVKCLLQNGTPIVAAQLTKHLNLEHNDESLLDIKDFIPESEAPIDKLIPQTEFDEYCTKDIAMNEGSDFHYSDVNDHDEDDVPLNELFTKTEKNEKSKNIQANVNVLKKHVRKYKKKKLGRKKCITKGTSKRSAKKENIDTNEKPENTAKNNSKNSNRGTLNLKEENKDRDDLITKHMKIKCELCNEAVERFKDLKTHFRESHNTKAFVVCCSQRFYKRFKLIDHIQVHLDPNYFKCKYCAKVLSSRACMEVHYANKHAEKSNLKYGCTFCERRFAQVSNLQAHLLSHSEERKFSCEICSKAFKSEYMLKIHKQKMHEKRQLYICDTCGKEYKFKPSFERHVAEHQTGVMAPTDECPICGKLLMPNGLRRHLDRHNLQDIECKICGKKVKSKAALTGHIEYAHKKTRSFACNFCDKTFKRPCVLKEHIAMHTGQKLYNCPNCSREFRSKANMYAHNKKVHRAQWEKAQAQLANQQKEERAQPRENEKSEEHIEMLLDATC